MLQKGPITQLGQSGSLIRTLNVFQCWLCFVQFSERAAKVSARLREQEPQRPRVQIPLGASFFETKVLFKKLMKNKRGILKKGFLGDLLLHSFFQLFYFAFVEVYPFSEVLGSKGTFVTHRVISCF